MLNMAETKVNYKVKVININTHLMVRNGAGTSHSVVDKLTNGATFEVDRVNTLPSGEVWYRQKGKDRWSCAKTASGQKYIKVVQNLDKNNGKPNKSNGKTPRKGSQGGNNNDDKKTDDTKANINSFTGIPDENLSVPIDGDDLIDISQLGPSNKAENDYSMWDIASEDRFQKELRKLKRHVNAPTAWTPNQLYKNVFLNFNRFKMDFPDLNLKGTRAAIFLTRPALNLLMFDGSGNVAIRDSANMSEKDKKAAGDGGVISDIRIYNLLRENITLGELLSGKARCSSQHGLNSHNFNPLLSNQAYSIDIKDDQVDVLETGETVTGYKIQYSKHSNKSMGLDSVTIKYKEIQDLSITKLHQIWVDYQSDVYKGILSPRYKRIWKRELDYLCNIYYFLLAEDGETILFWSKFYGAFPVNVPKSVLSYDRGSQVQFPEVSVTYNYIFKEDLSPQALVEFNEDSAIAKNGLKNIYEPIYRPQKLHTGSTWVGLPYVQSVAKNSPLGNAGAYDLKLRFGVKAADID